jgi:2-polyprenyl-3-methyl-5-hydroxy-6-metoxy-1,4-benzoquinol methylase
VDMTKLSYLLRSTIRYPFGHASACPNCGSKSCAVMDRKYVVTTLLRCKDCCLMFRAPTDSEEFNRIFYNFHYQEGIAMICPTDQEIAALKTSNFAGSERDFAGYVSFLQRHGLASGARVLDFGCSWGYGSYQFANAGFDVYSYEIGVDRRNYAIDKLGVRHLDDPSLIVEGHPLYSTFDCFFSAHVLEHVPSPSKVIEIAAKCLKPGGLFVAFTPNGNAGFRDHDPRGWRNMWGAVHPNYLDEVFYDHNFSRSKRHYGSRDGSDLNAQYELGFVAIKGSTKDQF